MKKGKLVKIQIRPGQFVKMYESDAIDQGHLKGKPQAPNKMRPQAPNKAAEPDEDKTPKQEPAEDFSVIPGVGPATARVLVAHGFTTFEQLREASLDFLPDGARAAIEAWLAPEEDPDQEEE